MEPHLVSVETAQSILDKYEQLAAEGFNILTFRQIADSFKFCRYADKGVFINMDHVTIGVGPQEHGKTVLIHKFTHKFLNDVGINPFALNIVANTFAKSKLLKKGLNVEINGVLITVGPQKDPLIIR